MTTNIPSTAIPAMSDDDRRAFATACSPKPASSVNSKDSSASKPGSPPSKDESRVQEALRSGIDASRELEEFCTTSPVMSADEIVARHLALETPPTASTNGQATTVLSMCKRVGRKRREGQVGEVRSDYERRPRQTRALPWHEP